MTDHHPTLPPSSFPMLSQCPCFIGSQHGSAAANRGTDDHRALTEFLTKYSATESEVGALTPAGINLLTENRRFAKILEVLYSDYQCNVQLVLIKDFEKVTFGTADIVSENVIVEYKSCGFNQIDYTPQLYCYALMLMDKIDSDEVIGYFAYPDYITPPIQITRRAAESVVWRIINNVQNPNKQPISCDFCDWCANQLTCPAFIPFAIQVAEKTRNDYPFDLALSNLHSSEIQNPETMSNLLTFAKWLQTVVDSIKFHAGEMAKSKKIPGYTLQSRQGRLEITDINQAFQLSGLTPEEFMSACSCSVSALREIFRKKFDLSEKKAGEEVEKMLASVLVRGAESSALVKERVKKEKKEKTIELDKDEFDSIIENERCKDDRHKPRFIL